ncbi:MAG: DNA mismatch repair protein MutS [Tannerellaceae bacterium]|nr:DNA mismatch repair protein MutS [Tannerellaceae bacterium]
MEKVYGYYRGIVEAYSLRVNNLKKKIHLMGTIRLLLVAGMIAAIWFLKDTNGLTLTGGILLFVIPFIILMAYHNFLSKRKAYAEGLISASNNELKGLDYDFSAYDGAPDKINGEHSFSLDLDLFGERSFFQSLNRTVTYPGRERLTDWFLHPLSDKKKILQRQEAVQELSGLTQLRQHFYVTGKLSSGEKNDTALISHLTNPTFNFRNKIWPVLIWAVPLLWMLILILTLLELLPPIILPIYFPLSFFIAYCKIGSINKIHDKVNKMEHIFSIYAKLFKSIEDDSFKSVELKEISSLLLKNKVTASQAIKKLSGYIRILDQRGNMGGAILNLFTIRENRSAWQIERWMETYGQEVENWFDALARFDALCSLAGFAFNHPDYTYPALADSYFRMSGKALGHPLLPRDMCVRNDISIEKSPSFMIVTGANMAGKSTFLRTIGINFLLARVGAPVCAEQLTIYPAHLVTSLRTSDSLVSNESYFFAELKRLKMIIDRLQQGEELFIILDEILKGTNSVDKQKGSLALIKQLVSYKTCGIIATHDLILGTLQEEYPEYVKNYRFEADITHDELTFSYQLREGIAQNMNACFLMQKMGITV